MHAKGTVATAAVPAKTPGNLGFSSWLLSLQGKPGYDLAGRCFRLVVVVEDGIVVYLDGKPAGSVNQPKIFGKDRAELGINIKGRVVFCPQMQA